RCGRLHARRPSSYGAGQARGPAGRLLARSPRRHAPARRLGSVFNVGPMEVTLILFVALLVFGPNKLPEIARNMGKFIRNFQQETNRALADLKSGIEPATKGIFDEPDEGSEQPSDAASATVPFIPAEQMKAKRPRSATARSSPDGKRRSAAAGSKKTASRRRSAAKPAAKKATKKTAAKK